MTVAELRLLLEREQALAALSGDDSAQVVRQLSAMIAENAKAWSYVRAHRDVLPPWWLRDRDPTQVDGRVRVLGAKNGWVDLSTFDGAKFGVMLQDFVEHVLLGRIIDST